MIMNKKNILSLIIVLALSFLYIILLDKEYIQGLNTLMLLLGILPVFVGIENSFHYINISLGKTRKQISNEYIKELIFTILLGFISIAIITIFAFVVYKDNEFNFISISLETVFIYSSALLISSLTMFVCNIIYAYKKNKKNIMFILVVIIIYLLSIIFNVFIYLKALYIIAIIINTLLFIVLSLVNKKIIMCKKM